MKTVLLKPLSSGFFSFRKTRKDRVQVRGKKEKGSFFTVHPLFFLVGVFYSLTGELPIFLMSCIVAVEHELAHAVAAARLGYRLHKIVLMPYGAVIDGEIEDLALKDEICVAAWGPLANLFTALLFAALWWFFPDTYAYTDTAFFLSLSIALVNLLPAYPLDGGRILKAVLSFCFLNGTKNTKNAEERAKKWCKGVTVCLSLLLIAAFFKLVCDGESNYSLLCFAVFLTAGAFSKDGEASYRKINFSNLSVLEKGVEIRRVAVLDSCPVKNVLPYLCRGKYLILDVYDRSERYLGEIRQSELGELFAEAGAYAPVGSFWRKFSSK